jgi:predicted small metal-binding protein
MFKFECKDLGLDCYHSECGETRVEVMQAAMKHAITAHGRMTSSFSMEESVAFMQKLEAAVQFGVEGRLNPQVQIVQVQEKVRAILPL